MSCSVCFVCSKVIAPVVSKRLFILRVQCSSWGEHDGGVQVSDDARNSTGCCDTGLGAFVPRLQCWQHQGHLEHVKHTIRYAERSFKHVVFRGVKTAKNNPSFWMHYTCLMIKQQRFLLTGCWPSMFKPVGWGCKCLEWKIWIRGGRWEKRK